ncbi:toxin-antitoxin system, antitoxin component, Xre family protein [Crocosphaera watsonii WH 8501]|uniref:Toxin-antitoxin system, antitoxin component, Xre family protein n=6 Tax=Crocosphaera watsonii TaxID=263511 RepID=Q4C055_CROWT|nr:MULTISPECIES: hypothetical protein [Crocosphaera]EAM49543.1 hypothetical protein CwatDRAFT_2121 [Crocosphaera watsonii WH 8501]EHJ11380.1 hypothetical protein CWATWH0003_3884 [Crocosphaera watsonii WH 0003]MCH2246585.1 toxin-antitoxin system, antitoxin component, Xre family protein [Crocosphaera sp.]NQZ62539.1 toxin-antitoxin system, antitoxin component, Xre family protein [Crocosphaera sp.]CCQ51248.1 hypothetical protein CWATWH8502_3883 [Crocosphaera watsonii WH 8502]
MTLNQTLESRLIEKVRQLSREQIEQVEQFIDGLNAEKSDQSLSLAATKLSESAFNKVWDNPEDDIYDEL